MKVPTHQSTHVYTVQDNVLVIVYDRLMKQKRGQVVFQPHNKT